MNTVKLNKWKKALKRLKVPAFYETEKQSNKERMVTAKFFLPGSGATWYVIEWDGEDTIFCYVTGMYMDEYGYSSLSELADVRLQKIFEVELDKYFSPIPMERVLSSS